LDLQDTLKLFNRVLTGRASKFIENSRIVCNDRTFKKKKLITGVAG